MKDNERLNSTSMLTKRTIPEIIDSGISHYIKDYKPYLKISLMFYGPGFFLYLLFDFITIITGLYNETASSLVFIAVSIFNPFIWFGSWLMIYRTGLFMTGRKEEIKNSYNILKHFAFTLVCLYIVSSLIVFLLIFASILILPVFFLIIFLVAMTLLEPVAVLEKHGVWETLKRITDMTYRNFSRVFFVSFLTSIIISIPSLAYSSLMPVNLSSMPWAVFLAQLGTIALIIILAPLTPIIKTFLYFDIKLREEGIDLYFQAEELSAANGNVLINNEPNPNSL